MDTFLRSLASALPCICNADSPFEETKPSPPSPLTDLAEEPLHQPTSEFRILGICERCDRINDWGYDDEELIFRCTDEFPDFPLLTTSAAKGCCLCGFWKEVILDDESRNTSREPRGPLRGGICFSVLWDERSVYLEYRLSEEFGHLDLHFVAEANDPAATKVSIQSRPLIREALSDSRKEKLVDMIEGCDLSPTAEIYLPTRLIDVGSDDVSPRLIISQSHTPFFPWLDSNKGGESSTRSQSTQAAPLPRYAALSYCWGPPEEAKKQLRTTKATLASHREGIDFHAMTATVRDTIILCRRLGIQYVWIDAICIVQDDRADWEVEAGRMADVYTGAEVTIAVAHGASCDSGFLADKPHIQVVPSTSDRRSTLSLVRFAGSDEETEIKGSPWNQRGWTLQEAVMSRRLLVFGSSMAHIFYNNLEERQSEDGSTRWTDWHPWDLPISVTTQEIHLRGDSVQLATRKWYNLMKQYTTRQLSYPSDRLPAVSALAASVVGEMEVYLAGLWTKNLHYGLVWSDQDPIMSSLCEAYREEEYQGIGPSWSWVSYGRPVVWPNHLTNCVWEFSPEFDYITNTVCVAGLNPFGCVEGGGKLVLQAKVAKMPSMSSVRRGTRKAAELLFQHFLPIGEWNVHVNFDRRSSCVDSSAGFISRDDPVYMMPSCKASFKGTSTEVVHLGLLLVKEGELGQGRFRRIGICSYSDERGPRTFWDGISACRVELA